MAASVIVPRTTYRRWKPPSTNTLSSGADLGSFPERFQAAPHDLEGSSPHYPELHHTVAVLDLSGPFVEFAVWGLLLDTGHVHGVCVASPSDNILDENIGKSAVRVLLL